MNTKSVKIIKIMNDEKQEINDEIVVEKIFNIFVNKKLYSSMMCTPNETMELSIGYLFAEGIISSMKEIKSVEEMNDNSICIILKHNIDDHLQSSRALTSGCAKGSMKLQSIDELNMKPIDINYKFKVDDILSLMKEFNRKSELFKETGGVHSCSICSSQDIIFFSEDIGRHNALDKVIGKSLFHNLNLDDKLVLTTGRISSDIALKSARLGIPIIVSHSAPTNMAVDIAKKLNITMVGFARGNRMNIYCGKDRIIL